MEILLFIFPLLSFLFFQFLGNKIDSKLLYILNIFLICLSFVISIYLFLKLLYFENDLPLYFLQIISSEYLFIDWSLRLDLFVSGLILIINFFGSVFTIYLTNFNKDNVTNFDIIKISQLLIFGTLTLISSNNLIQFFVGWQIIILSSYLVSNMSRKQNHFQNDGNTFLFNRLSDLGVFLCLFFLYSYTNSFKFDAILESNYLSKSIKLFLFNIEFSNFEFILFVLFFSFLLRIRQFFAKNSKYHFLKINFSIIALLYSGVYLPSGIYFLVRFLPLVQSNYNFFNLIILLGFILTILFTLLLFTSKDLKSLALYVASSQFSIIILLTGLKIYNGVFFYLLTSTLSVTMLFLSFAIIIKKLNGEYQINKMGSLLFKTPSTFLFTLISYFSLIGVPFFSGFYSKKLILYSMLSFNKVGLFIPIIICFCYIFILSYILFKMILIVFLCQNNCNIHLYNKINEKMILIKTVLFILAICLTFSGWFLNNLFSGSNPEYLWNLVLNVNSDISIKKEGQIYERFIIYTNIICLLGFLLSIFNYVIIPKFGNNIKIKHNKLFKKYTSYFSSNS